MGQIVSAHAYCNNEVALIAWNIDKKIDGCLGIQITGVYVDQSGTPTGDRRILAAWVPFNHFQNSTRLNVLAKFLHTQQLWSLAAKYRWASVFC